MTELHLPYNYHARSYQVPFWEAMNKHNKRRACLVWHRRSGKSKTLLNFEIQKAFERVGVYYHAFPEYNQGRKILWDGIDKDGQKLLDHIPPQLRKSTNKTEMKIELINGSIWQIIGADNYDSLVGPNPVGIVLDEWAVSDKYPLAWDYFRPILAENRGWAVFPYTPRGMNHGYTLHQMAIVNPDWFHQVLTVDDTQAISRFDIQAEREAGMSEDMIQQEFYCSFVASTEDIVIPFSLIEPALTREVYYQRSPKIAGLDVARFGNDRTALIVRQGGQIIHVETWGQVDIVQTASRVMDRYKAKLFDAVAVDTIGIGAGVADILKSNDVPVAMVQVSERPMDEERFDTQRDELWWKLREWFEDGVCSISRAIMPRQIQMLLKDIQDIRFKYNLKNKIKIESKEDMKKRLGYSPDIGDALCLTFTHKIRYKAQQTQQRTRETALGGWMQRKEKQYDGHYQEVRVR